MNTRLISATTCSLNMGGSSTFLLNLAKGLRHAGWQLQIVVVGGTNEMDAEFASNSVPVIQVPRAGIIYEDRLALAYRHIAATRPAMVLACLGFDSFELLRLAPPGVRRVGVIQSDDPGPYTTREFGPWLDAMVGVSRQICDRLRQFPELTGKRIECIPYGIDFSPTAAPPRATATGPLRVVYVGRLIEVQKRVSRLVSVIQHLHARRAPVAFTLIGSGPEEAQVRRDLAGLDHVKLLGEVPNREIATLLREQDVILLLSDFEGLPLSLLEAMREGVVPVVSDLESGLRDLVSAERGVRVPVGDVERAAEVLMRFASDRASLRPLAEACRRVVREEYHADTMARRYVALLDDATATPHWPAEPRIPTPLGVKPPWLFRGLSREIRRALRRLLPGGP
jgi:glycosyltransferase involved in cell wall biosynthesis